jgi:hypothetical protein
VLTSIGAKFLIGDLAGGSSVGAAAKPAAAAVERKAAPAAAPEKKRAAGPAHPFTFGEQISYGDPAWYQGWNSPVSVVFEIALVW